MPHDHTHAHDHHHGHAHDRDASHGDEPALSATPGRPIDPGFSLLALGAGSRLLGAAVLSGLVWVFAWWAVSA